MKLKRLFSVLCVVVMIWSVPVFACGSNSGPRYTEKQVDIRNAKITFISRTEEHKVGYRCYPVLDIHIKENQAGVLQDGDVIYFETSKVGKKYVASSTLDIEAKGLTVEEVSNETENHFAIRISRGNKRELAQIDIRFEGELSGDKYTERDAPTFSLFLNVDKTKEKNLFAGEENILLNKEFLVLISETLEREKQIAEKKQNFKKLFPNMTFSIGTNQMIWKEEQTQLKYPVYINQNNIAMLSMEDFLEIIKSLNQMEKIGQIIIKPYDDQNGYSIINEMYLYKINFDDFSIVHNGIIRRDIIIEKENDVYFISVRGVAEILGVENGVVWDDSRKTISIGANF